MPLTVSGSGTGVGVEYFQTHEIGDVASTKSVSRDHQPHETILAQRTAIEGDSDDVWLIAELRVDLAQCDHDLIAIAARRNCWPCRPAKWRGSGACGSTAYGWSCFSSVLAPHVFCWY
jgi:hypothetical protein